MRTKLDFPRNMHVTVENIFQQLQYINNIPNYFTNDLDPITESDAWDIFNELNSKSCPTDFEQFTLKLIDKLPDLFNMGFFSETKFVFSTKYREISFQYYDNPKNIILFKKYLKMNKLNESCPIDDYLTELDEQENQNLNEGFLGNTATGALGAAGIIGGAIAGAGAVGASATGAGILALATGTIATAGAGAIIIGAGAGLLAAAAVVSVAGITYELLRDKVLTKKGRNLLKAELENWIKIGVFEKVETNLFDTELNLYIPGVRFPYQLTVRKEKNKKFANTVTKSNNLIITINKLVGGKNAKTNVAWSETGFYETFVELHKTISADLKSGLLAKTLKESGKLSKAPEISEDNIKFWEALVAKNLKAAKSLITKFRLVDKELLTEENQETEV